jgi:hypothetical protein
MGRIQNSLPWSPQFKNSLGSDWNRKKAQGKSSSSIMRRKPPQISWPLRAETSGHITFSAFRGASRLVRYPCPGPPSTGLWPLCGVFGEVPPAQPGFHFYDKPVFRPLPERLVLLGGGQHLIADHGSMILLAGPKQHFACASKRLDWDDFQILPSASRNLVPLPLLDCRKERLVRTRKEPVCVRQDK